MEKKGDGLGTQAISRGLKTASGISSPSPFFFPSARRAVRGGMRKSPGSPLVEDEKPYLSIIGRGAKLNLEDQWFSHFYSCPPLPPDRVTEDRQYPPVGGSPPLAPDGRGAS